VKLYWQVVPGLDGSQNGAPTSCGYDGFEIGINSQKGDVASAVAAANAAVAAQDWTGYL
jgi:mannan endo-1,4-beta-mannosidase